MHTIGELKKHGYLQDRDVSFLAAQGHTFGASLWAEGDLEPARHAIAIASESRCRLELPEDLLLAEGPEANAGPRVLDGVDVPDGWIGLDIGPRTAAPYARELFLLLLEVVGHRQAARG